jgi:anti-anti-sigma regulatory factor
MDVETQATGLEIRLTRSGELTLASAQQLRSELCETLELGGPVVLDLAQVTEVDLACLQVLASAERSFAANGMRLRILRAPAVEQAWSDAGFPRGE